MKQYTDKRLQSISDLMTSVQAENIRQIMKWGIQTHSSFEWLVYAMEEVGECAEAISDAEYNFGDKEDVIKEAIQAATLLLKIAEMYADRPDPEGVYLAGPMVDCDNKEMNSWRSKAKTTIHMDIPVLDPCNFESDDTKLYESMDLIVLPDKQAIDKCEYVLANCWKPSAGTSMEIIYAWERKKRVISVVPNEGLVSPWVFAHSEVVFRELDEACNFINSECNE